MDQKVFGVMLMLWSSPIMALMHKMKLKLGKKIRIKEVDKQNEEDEV